MRWIIERAVFLGYAAIFTVSLGVLAAVAAVAAIMTLPDVGQLEKCITTTMFQVRLCKGGDKYIEIKDISPYVLHAVIAAEDGSFYDHKGFDWHEIRESMQANLTTGGFRRGGSTLTQQLAKNVFLDQEKSLWRKMKEAYLANGIENRFDKSFILEKYLNVVEFGPNLYGIKPASLHYFHKSPSQLTPLEAAWLAMLLPNPKKYSQSFRSGKLTPFARKMIQVILKRMTSFGKLAPSAYQTAVANLDAFPWSGLTLADFGGSGTYSLETDVPASSVQGQDAGLDENALETLLEREDAPDEKARAAPEREDTAEDEDLAPIENM